jgi:LacI family transcriptional regulator
MSLKKIAEELGFSLTTVSRALNGYPEVAKATREAVMAAAVRHGHQTDARARGLALGRSDAVGLVFPMTPSDLGDPLLLEVISHLSAQLAQAHRDLLIISASTEDEVAAYQRAIAGRRVDAFVVPRTRVSDARLALLQAEGVPFVAYGRSSGFEAPYAWLDFDNLAGARMATQRLIALGHHRLGYLGAAPLYNFADQRFKGFAAALHDAGLCLEPALVQRGALDRRAGYAGMAQLLALASPPSAVLVDNHLAGVGAVLAARDAGLVLGQDFSLIVYDGLEADHAVLGAVTSVQQPTAAAVGQTLAELLLARLKGDDPATLQRLRMPVLVDGASDGPRSSSASFW